MQRNNPQTNLLLAYSKRESQRESQSISGSLSVSGFLFGSVSGSLSGSLCLTGGGELVVLRDSNACITDSEFHAALQMFGRASSCFWSFLR